MTELELLRATRRRLVEKGWVQGLMGGPSGPNCLEGALHFECRAPFVESTPVQSAIRKTLTRRIAAPNLSLASLAYWNDTSGRTLSEVLALLDDEIAAREEHEGVEAEPVREPVAV